MIDPANITKFDRTEEELQEFLLFCVMVQGKKSDIQSVKLNHFLTWLAHYTGERTPFDMVKIALGVEDDETGETLLVQALRKFGLGQYTRLCQALAEIVDLPDLRTVTVETLVKCFAIGPKTARFFVVHSRPNQRYAILDTHVLKWLRSRGVPTPKLTPQGDLYGHLEKIFLTFVLASGKSVAEFDLEIWREYAK